MTDVFGFRKGPTLKPGLTTADLWSSAVDTPLSRTQTFFESRSAGVLESFGLGTEIRSFAIPQGNPELAPPTALNRVEEAAGPLGLPTRIARQIYQSTFNEDQPQMTEEQYKQSRYFRTDVPWDGAMTEQRAAALAEWHDVAKRREYFGSKRPVTAFLGKLMGGAIDPINYIPAGGPFIKAAATYNILKAAGPTAARFLAPALTASFDAATNTALAALITRGERSRYGDDVSFQATMMQIGMGAIIGAGFGGAHAGYSFLRGRVDADFVNAYKRVQNEKLGALANVKRSLIPLNEAVDGTLHGETPNLSPNGVDAVARINAEGRAKTPDVETVMTARMKNAGLPDDEAVAAASTIHAFHETQAERLGITTEEFTARHGLPEVRGGEPTTADLVAGELRQGGRRTIELPDGRVADVQNPYPGTFRAVVGGDPSIAPGDYRMVSPFERVEGPRTIGELNITTDRGAPYVTSVSVDLKRAGIATALYDAAEASLGRKLVPSPTIISDEAIGFWRSRLAQLDPNEKQAMLAETLRIGQEKGIGKTARKVVDRLGYDENYVPSDTFFQSAAPLTGFPLRVEGTGPGGLVTKRNLAEALTERHMARYGRVLDPNDPADHAIILDSLKEDYANQKNMSDNGEAWYVEDIDEAIRVTEAIIPELAIPENRQLFLTIAALLSPQQKPRQNWGNAIIAMQGFLRDGVIPTRKPSGKQFGVASHTTGLQLMQHLINTKGLTEALNWVNSMHTGREMAEIRRDSGLFANTDLQSNLPGETNMKESKLGIYMMGPKVGDFAQNSTGLDPNAITIDLWAMRAYNRLIGRLTDVPDKIAAEGGLPDQPRGRGEREQVKQLFREAAEDAGISPSAMQAALWYFEQRLYRTHGIRSDSQNFSGAARTAATERGITVGERSADRGGTSGDLEAAGGDAAAGAGEGQTFYQSARPGEVGVAFVSPNVENLDFAGAQTALGGERQTALRTASLEIDTALGITTTGHDVIGAWSDGAENSTMAVVNDADWDTMVVSAAMKGHLADQKAVLVFKEGEEGDAAFYQFEAKGSLDDIHKNLLEDGVAFHTIVPTKDGATIYVADLDRSAHGAVKKAADRYGTEIDTRYGRAEFVGTRKEDGTDRAQRDDARRAYEDVIRRSPLQGASAVWEGVHNRWGEALTPRRPNLSEGKFSDRIAELKARRKAFDADVAAATQNGSVRMVSDTNPNEAVLIGPDMSEPGKFRRTHFDEQGPSGHVTYDTREEALRGTFGLYHPERADARIAGETDKVFAKRVVDKRPAPEALPEKYDDYFIMDKAEIVPIEDLVSSKTAEENAQGGGNAAKRMDAAAKGELSKRDPITVERRPDGKYLIKDGNGTYTSVKGYGWKHMPVLVEGGKVVTKDVQKLLDDADTTLPHDVQEAVSDFVGHGPNARETGGTGLMLASKMEAIARGEAPTLAAKLEAAFAPVREKLRQMYGNRVRLYRVQQPVEQRPGRTVVGFPSDNRRAALSWTADQRFAEIHAGIRRPDQPPFTEEQIAAFEDEFAKTGKVRINTNTELRKVSENDANGDPIEYVGIYSDTAGGFVTDTDSVRAYVEGINVDRAEFNAENAEKRASIVTSDVALDDVIWATDRAGQTEFIVRNREGKSPYIDPTGKALLFQPGDMKQGGGARGSIHFGDVKTVITLFKNADASTALHETGHYFLKLFRQMAEKDGAPASITADWAIVKDWWRSNAEAVVKDSGMENLTAADVHAVLDNGTTGDAAKDAAIDRGLHEQWARGFERYLREGQAPSPRLAGVFEQFKTWLTKIYKKALELDVDISPEIRGVFDRMLGGKETGYKLAEDDFYRPSHKTFDEIYAVATERQNELNDIGRGIANELDVEFRTSPKGVKLREKAEGKIALKGYSSPSHVTDIVRAGFLLDFPEKADAIISRLRQYFDVIDEGWNVTKAGYFDRKALVRFDDGTVAEIQFWEPNLLDAKEKQGGHALYDEMNTHPEGSPEHIRLEAEQQVLYGKALSEADTSWEPVVAEGRGKRSRPNLLKRSLQTSSVFSAPVDQTSAQSTFVHGAPGSSLANAADTPSSSLVNRTAGRPSQLTYSTDLSPSMREGSTPASVTQPDTTRAPPEPVPEGLKEATATVGKSETPKDLAAQFGIDLATGEFDELADIEVMREAGRLTPEDEEAIKAADETAEAAEAYGNALKAALFCLV